MFKEEKVFENKVCKYCGCGFSITDKDLEFYKKISPIFGGQKYLIPSPTLCPDCRQQRRLSFRNERKLYKRKCDATGKDIISIYSPDKPYKVYEQNYWWSDNWNTLDYGKNFDFNKTFFEQFDKLMREVPQKHLIKFFNNENSEYTNYVGELKNCYLEFGGVFLENCLYGYENWKCNNILDCLICENSNNLYESIGTQYSSNSKFIYYSENIESSSFIFNCKNIKNCFCCANLQNKKFYIFNKEYSEDEYYKKIEKIYNGNFNELEKIKLEFKEFILKFPRKNLEIKSSQNSSGDYLEFCNNCENCFQVRFEKNENAKYCYESSGIIDMMDVNNSLQNSFLAIDGYNFVNSSNVGFSFHLENCSNIFYSIFLENCKHCFLCIGLRNKSYCILNKQYSKEEYETLVPKIIEHMKKTGEWGEFFPSSISPFGYNETVAQEYFPLTRRDVFQKHLYQDGKQIFNWSDYEPPFPKVDKIIKASMLPENISDIPDDILNRAVECEITKKPFKITKQELDFYRKYNLPIPKRHPDQRHLDRLALRNPRKLWTRKCDKCGKDIKTTYSPERKEIVYCGICYEKEIY